MITARVVPLVLLAAQSGIYGQQNNAQRPTKVLTVCEVLSRALEYDGHVLTIRDRLSGADEGAWLSSDNCPGVLTTEGHVWPSVIFLAMPSTTLRIHSVPFQFDQGSMTRVDAKYRRLAEHHRPECLVFTYTGLFETRKDWSSAKMRYPNKTWKFAGFGHLGEAPGQLLLRSYDDVSLDRGCEASGSPGGVRKDAGRKW